MKVLSIVLMFGLFVSLSAQSGIKQTQKNQAKRIKQGVKSGELTKREARKLVQGQKKVNRMKKNAKADGVITKRERVKIKKEQKKQSAKIYKQKHDSQKNWKRKRKNN